MILDTTFVIDLFRKSRDAIEKASELDKRNDILFVTPVTIFELWYGIDPKEKKQELLSKFVGDFEILGFDSESAKNGGSIHSELKTRGIPVDVGDSMIAGIAMKNNETILTRDEHFSRIKGVTIEKY